jgi:hypothetical protein
VSAQTEIRIGSEFVGYRIDELIGRGGMGVVYRAYDLRLKRTVALKLMASELALDQGFRERFSREAELAMSLEHPNVVPIHDAGDIDGRLYLAMRHVEGTDLRALLHAEGPLDIARALPVTPEALAAIAGVIVAAPWSQSSSSDFGARLSSPFPEAPHPVTPSATYFASNSASPSCTPRSTASTSVAGPPRCRSTRWARSRSSTTV